MSAAERETLPEIVRKLKVSSLKVRRAQVPLKADADGPGWTDAKIAEAYGCRTKTVENIRERFVTEGFELTLNGQPHARRPKLLTGDQEAKINATRLSSPPPGFAHWTLRLLTERVVALEIVDAISHETVRRTLKKRRHGPQTRVLGDPAEAERGVRGPQGRGDRGL